MEDMERMAADKPSKDKENLETLSLLDQLYLESKNQSKNNYHQRYAEKCH